MKTRLPNFRPPRSSQHSTQISRLLLCALTCALSFVSPVSGQSTEQQLKAVETIWGFDGRVQPGQFNQLSILLDNQTDDTIDATATLQRIQGMLSPTGGQLVQPVFISPTMRRWIHFYPYVSDSRQCEWHLEIDGRKIADITQPRAAVKLPTENTDQPPQVVILDIAGRISTQPAALKHMPENIFPPYATVTFGLHTVFLDHVPDWELPRQQAFLSWLKQGGRLQLLKDSRGEYPQFDGALVDLNQPLDQFRIEQGLIVRNSIQRNQVTEETVRRAMVIDVLNGPDKEFEDELNELDQKMGQVPKLTDTEPSAIDDTFFRRMRELTLPEHAWWLIFLLALCYIGLIFPGCFALSKRRDLHFLTTYGAIVGLAFVFSLLFLLIGRRGYGETTNLQTLAVARAEDNTHWNIMQWNTLFVTAGDDYLARSDEQQIVISTGDTMDRSDAQATPGNSGQIAMRIPPFSSQTFLSRRRVSSEDWKLHISSIDLQPSGLIDLTIRTGSAFPMESDGYYLILAGRRLYEMKYNAKNQSLELFGKKRKVAEFCQPRYVFDYGYMDTTAKSTNIWGKPYDQLTEQEIFFDEALPLLMQRSLLDDLAHQPSEFELPNDRVRLYAYTSFPAALQINLSAEAKRTGRVLFVKDILLQDAAKPSQ